MSEAIARVAAALNDRYRVERELGAGGMATVYLAHDLKHDRDVAIKVLRPELAAALGAERFLAEVKITARLDHAHILTLIDSGNAEGLLYYVMPFVRGETLSCIYHGWVYGYGLHLVDNRVGFPKWVQIETAAVAESDGIDQQATPLIQHFRPETMTTDNSDAKARRIRQWAQQGVVLLSPAVKWVKGRDALAYHRYSQQPENAELLRRRRTAIEPVFDLIAQVLGTKAKQKQLPLQKLSNVRTCLALATLTVQVAMIAHSIWGLPLRNISTMAAAFT